jgi:hypothetical protein
MPKSPANPARSFVLQTGADPVRVEIDDNGEIIWTDELRTAHEYGDAFRAMGGDRSQLVEFVDEWELRVAGTGPLRTLLRLLGSPREVIGAAADALLTVLGMVSADPRLHPFPEHEAVSGAIKLALEYQMIGKGWSWDEHELGVWRLEQAKHDMSPWWASRNMVDGAMALLGAVANDAVFQPRQREEHRSYWLDSRVSISPLTLSNALVTLTECRCAMGYVTTGLKTATITDKAWFEAVHEWGGDQRARLAELVRVSQAGPNAWARLTRDLRGRL